MAVGRLGDRDVVVTGSGDGTVRIWDATETPFGNPLSSHDGLVLAVAVGRLGDRDVVISADADRTLQISRNDGLETVRM